MSSPAAFFRTNRGRAPFGAGPPWAGAEAPSLPRREARRFATGERLISGTTFPLGRPRWDRRIVFAPFSMDRRIVGRIALIRVSSVMFPALSRGTLRSTRMSVRFPARSSWSMVRTFILPLPGGLHEWYQKAKPPSAPYQPHHDLERDEHDDDDLQRLGAGRRRPVVQDRVDVLQGFQLVAG